MLPLERHRTDLLAGEGLPADFPRGRDELLAPDVLLVRRVQRRLATGQRLAPERLRLQQVVGRRAREVERPREVRREPRRDLVLRAELAPRDLSLSGSPWPPRSSPFSSATKGLARLTWYSRALSAVVISPVT